MNIQEKDTVGDIVSRDFRAAEVFSAHGLDFCCGGKTPLAEACQEKELDVTQILAELKEILTTEQPLFSFGTWSNVELIKHIVEVHHRYIEDSVPYLSRLLRKIADVHGQRHPELVEVYNIFDEATDALYDHMKKEEMILFPAIEALEQAMEHNKSVPPFGFGSIANPIKAMEDDHDFEGDAFKKIALLTNDFTPPEDACSTYTVAFAKLKEFVADLHRHIHLENNILFENVKALELKLSE